MNNPKIVFKKDLYLSLWYHVVLAILCLSILRGIRFPNLWSYTHFLFNYTSGFVKRGLIGGIIRYAESPWLTSYDFFFLFSVFIFLINMLLLAMLIRDFINSRNLVLIGGTIIFASSLAVVFLSHIIGYSDHLGLLITLITMRINGFLKKILFLLPSLIIALLIHEAIVIIFFPVIFVLLLFEGQQDIQKLVLLGLFSALLVGLTFLMSHATIEKQEAWTMYRNLRTEAGYPLRKDAFDVLHRSSKDNLNIMKKYWSEEKQLISLINSLLVTLPTLLLFLYLIVNILRRSATKIYLILLALLAVISPLSLHIIAWDMHRWNTWTITMSFILLYGIYKLKVKQHPLLIEFSPSFYPMVIFVIFLNGASTVQLFDGYFVKQFPFIAHQKYVTDSDGLIFLPHL